MGRGYLWPQLKVDLLLFTFLAFVAQLVNTRVGVSR